MLDQPLRQLPAWLWERIREPFALFGLIPAGVVAVAAILPWYLTRGGQLMDIREAMLSPELAGFRGEVIGLVGNRRALLARKRYLTEDLNRIWTEDRVAEELNLVLTLEPAVGDHPLLRGQDERVQNGLRKLVDRVALSRVESHHEAVFDGVEDQVFGGLGEPGVD